MKKNLLAALFSLFLLPACKETKTKSKEKSTDDYRKEVSKNKPDRENGTGEFDIAAPKGWTKTDTFMQGQRIVFVKSPRENANDDFLENVNVVTENTGNMKMDEYLDLSATNIKKGLENVELGKMSDRNINGMEFKRQRYSHVYNGIPIDVDVWFLLNGGTAYVITCSSKGGEISKWEPEFEKVIRSFKLN